MTETAFRSILPRLLPFRVPSRIEAVLARAAGLPEIENTHRTLQTMGDATPIAERLLRHLQVTVRVSERDLDRIPKRGPVLLVVNHPFGLLEGAVLASLLARLRPDTKFLANGLLAEVPEMRDLLIAVDALGGERATQSNQAGIRRSIDFLASGGLLVVFPAGEVSHFQWREQSVTDPKWNPAVARMAALAARRRPDISVVPAFVEGSNSFLFHAAGILHPRLRTLLLGRELLNKRESCVAVRIGSAIAAEKLLGISTHEEQTAYLRWRTYLLASRQEYKPKTAWPLARRGQAAGKREPVAAPSAAAAMARDIEALPPDRCLARSKDLTTYLAHAAEIPSVLAEIARLREITFRAAGEGTGNSVDLDTFDACYLHLFVWNEAKQEIAGAYRLAGTDTVRSRFGIRGLYTATLFRYGDEFLDRMGPALELGRSFVRLEYQRGFAPLLLLWKGIGKYVSRNPRYRVLFGPVSISNQYHSLSRQLIVSFLERRAWLKEWNGLVSTRNPFQSRSRSFPSAALDIDDLSAVVSDLEPTRSGVPVLLRQYLKLGGRLLGFNVDAKFSGALDGLIVVDLTRTEPKLLERYLGRKEAAQFLLSQKGSYATQ